MDANLVRLRSILASAMRGLTLDQLTRHPQGKWSPAEILEHLNLTYTGTILGLDRCLQSGTTSANSDRSRMRWQRLLVIQAGYFPHGRQSPPRVQPRGTPAEQVTAEILENVSRMDGVIQQCEIRFGRTQSLADHPVLGPLTAAEWCKFHLVHGKHHAKQIRRLRETL
jgi:Protein of unknown function (DUF1569)